MYFTEPLSFGEIKFFGILTIFSWRDRPSYR